MALDWKSVKQTQTFVKEGVDIILKQGLDGWESVKEQLEEWRMGAGLDGPREATVAGWGIVDAFTMEDHAKKPGDLFRERYGAAAYAELRYRMKPYAAGSFAEGVCLGLRDAVDKAADEVPPDEGQRTPVRDRGHPQLADIEHYFFTGIVENKQGKEWPAILVPAPKREGCLRVEGWTLLTLSPEGAENYGTALQRLGTQVRNRRATRGE